jgi:hypothetical protein
MRLAWDYVCMWNMIIFVSICRRRMSNFQYIATIKVKVNVRFPLCLKWAPRHEDLSGEWRYSSILSLTSALGGGEWSASHPSRFTPRVRAPGTHWIRAWVDPRTILDAVVKRKIPSPRRESNPRTPIVQPLAQRYTEWAIMAIIILRPFISFIIHVQHR